MQLARIPRPDGSTALGSGSALSASGGTARAGENSECTKGSRGFGDSARGPFGAGGGFVLGLDPLASKYGKDGHRAPRLRHRRRRWSRDHLHRPSESCSRALPALPVLTGERLPSPLQVTLSLSQTAHAPSAEVGPSRGASGAAVGFASGSPTASDGLLNSSFGASHPGVTPSSLPSMELSCEFGHSPRSERNLLAGGKTPLESRISFSTGSSRGSRPIGEMIAQR